MKRIKNLDELIAAAMAKRSVTTSCGTMPATFVANWSGHILHRFLKNGIYLYKPKKKVKVLKP